MIIKRIQMLFTRRWTLVTLIVAAVLGTGGALYYYYHLLPVNPEDIPVARVGDRVITLRDFTTNYEFGFPHIKVGKELKERRRAYLMAMVNELLLAEEGYKLGYDKHQRVEDNDREVSADLLVESLIKDEVVSKTSVLDSEIRLAINKSKVLFKLRYWGEPTLERAAHVRESMLRKGFVPVLDSLRKAHPELPSDPSLFESEYRNAFELDPVMLGAIQGLQLGEFSQPVQYDNGFYVIQLVDLRRQGVMELEYASHYGTMKKVLLNTKYDTGIERFVGAFMTDKKIVTKGEPFWMLSDAVAEWLTSGDYLKKMLRDAVYGAGSDRPGYLQLKQQWNAPLVVFRDGSYTVGEFLEFYKPSLRDLDITNMEKFRHLISGQVAIAVRDQLLAQEARRRGLDNTSDFTHERNLWKNKSVYEETRESYVGGLRPDTAPAEIRTRLFRKADSLRAVTRVEINYAIIDTLNIPESASSRWMGMQLFKLGNKKLAVPMTDGVWGKAQ